jgi:hypothetical protein
VNLWSGNLTAAPIGKADLSASLRRIGFAGDRPASLETLSRVVRLHSHAIAFESLDSLEGKRVSIELDAMKRQGRRDPAAAGCAALDAKLAELALRS